MIEVLADTEALVKALLALDLATTPDEESAARLRLEIECALQQANHIEWMRQQMLRNLDRGQGIGGWTPNNLQRKGT